MKHTPAKWITALVLGSLTACSSDIQHDNPFDPDTPVSQQARASLSGTVVLERNGDPREATVLVTFPGGQQQINPSEDGAFFLQGIPPGPRTVSFDAPHYQRAESQLSFSLAEEKALGPVTLTLRKSPVRGAVAVESSAAGSETPGGTIVQLTLVKPVAKTLAPRFSAAAEDAGTDETLSFSTVAQSDGEYQFSEVPAGVYDVAASKETAGAETTQITVEGDGEVVVKTLTLKPLTGDFSILEGAYTNDRLVSLSLLGFNADQVQIGLELPGGCDYDQSPQTYMASATYLLPDADGLHVVCVRYLDLEGRQTTSYKRTILLDRVGPVLPAIAFEDGAYTNSTSVILALSVSGADQYKVTDASNPTGAWEPLATKKSVPLTGADGPQTVYASFRDLAGNEAGPIPATILLDSEAPSAATSVAADVLKINYGAPVTSEYNVAVVLNVSGAWEVQFSESSIFAGAVWMPFTPTLSLTLSAGNGSKTLYARVRDEAGNELSGMSDSIIVDTRAPTVAFISVQAEVTSSTTVSLSLGSGESAATPMEMQLSQDAAFTGASWIDYQPFTTVTVTGADGEKRIYAKFRKENGFETNPVSDSFVLDRTGPNFAMVTINNGAAYTGSNLVTLNFTGIDETSAVDRMMISESPVFAGATMQPYVLALAYPLGGLDGLKTLYVRYFDRAGNPSLDTAADIVLDTVDPDVVSFEVEDGGGNAVTLTNQTRLVVNLDATDANPLQMMVSNRGDFQGSAWQPYQPTLLWDVAVPQLPAGEPRTVYAKVRDEAGRTVSAVNYSFTVDTVAPSGVSIDIAGALVTSTTVSVAFGYSNADEIELSTDVNFQTKLVFSARAATSFTFPAGDGAKVLHARFRDDAGNLSAVVSDQVILDTSGPALASFTIDEGVLTNASTLHLRLSAVDAAEMRIGENTCAGGWAPFAATASYDFASTLEESKTITAQYRDAAGNVSPCLSATITFDETEPQFTGTPIVLQAGETSTTDRAVSFALAVTGATEMQLSESMTFVGAVWTPVTLTGTWSLSAGDGLKAVWVRLRDAAGNQTVPAVGNITLDTTAPGFNAATAPPVTNQTGVTLALTADNADLMRISLDPSFTAAAWIPFVAAAPATLPAGDGSKTVYIQLADDAGNESIVRSVTIELDQSVPAAPAASLLGGAYTNTATVSLQVVAGQVTQMLVSQFAAMTDATWQPYSQLRSFVLAGGQGAKTLYVKVRDAAGNTSPAALVAVEYDAANPVVTLYEARDAGGNTITQTNATRFYLALAATDATPLTVQFSATNLFSGVPVEGLQSLRAWDVVAPSAQLGETRTVYARIADAAGNSAIVGPLNVLVDTVGPTAPGLSLGATQVSSPTLQVTLSANNADFVELADDISFLSPLRFSMRATTSYTLPAGDGIKTLYARYADQLGNYSPIAAANVTLDQTPPQLASFSIDEGALTNLSSIHLNLVAVDATSMQVAESICGGLWLPYSGTHTHLFSTTTEGARTIAVRFKDAVGNETACLTRNITLDTTKPYFTSASVIKINGDATSTTERAVSLSFDVTEATSMLVSENPSFIGANWISFSSTLGWVLSAGEGEKTIFARFRDLAGNETVDKDDTISLVLSTPSISILDGAYTNDVTVQVQILAQNATEVQLSQTSDMSGAPWLSFSNVKSFILTGADGLKTVYARTRDGTGNISGQASAIISLDRAAPYLDVDALLINSDATSTTERGVTLSFAVTEATEMLLSENAGFAGANWVPFTPSYGFILSAGDGVKTVYGKFRDAARNMTGIVSDTIFTAPSTPSISIIGGGFTRFTNVNVQILSSNATEVLISLLPDMSDATWQPYNAIKAVALTGADGIKVIYVRVRDGVGNVSGQAQATITLDRVAPNVTYFSPIDAFGAPINYSTQTRYFLAVTATDLSEPMTVQFSSYNGFIGATPFEFMANTFWPWDAEPATSSDGEVRSTYLRLVDAAGNVAYAGPVTALVDNVGVEQSGSSAMQIAPNPTSSATVNVALTSDSGAFVELSEDPLFASPPPSFSMRPATTYTFASGDGLKILWARFLDSGGFPENPVSAVTLLDTTFPQNVTFSIDEAPIAPRLSITIRSGTTGADEMQISDAFCGGGDWEPFATAKPFTFTSGINGPRTIYVRYRDIVNHQTACAVQPLMLDTSRPSITGLWPSIGSVGSVVYIYGTNIGQAVGTVTFGGVQAPILSWTDSQITVEVPAAAIVGPTTVIAYVDGQPSTPFEFEVLPGITNLAPSTSFVGDIVRLSGGGFGPSQGASILSVGGIQPTVVDWTPTYVDFEVPPGIGAKTQPVFVNVGGAQSNTRYLQIEPHITSLSLATGTSNTVVVATGTNFGFTQGTNQLLINDAGVSVLSWSNTEITFTVTDTMAPGQMSVVIVFGALSSDVVYFEHIRPWIDLTYPANVTAGEELWVVGRYFGAAPGQVLIGGAVAPLASWTAGAIAVTIPASAVTGPASVWIETTWGATSNNLPLYIRHADEWLSFDVPLERSEHSLVWTGSEMVVWGGSSSLGGVHEDGWKYNPATDSWSKMTTVAQPLGRSYHTAVWTGTEMIIWGGYANTIPLGWHYTDTGGIYDPASDSWRPTATANAPTGRYLHAAVWTGSDMIVFGGEEEPTSTGVNTGGIYNLATDIWAPTPVTGAPLARVYAQAVWAGNSMVVFGGLDWWSWDPIEEGARFNPVTKTWAPMSLSNSPGAKAYHSLVWTGSEVLAWGGYDGSWWETELGGRYSPSSDTWMFMNTVGQDPRAEHATVWTGADMIVWSGCTWSWGCSDRGGARYNVVANTWQTISRNLTNAPLGGSEYIPAVWTGADMIVFGGSNGSERNSGGRYNAANNSWTGIGFTAVPPGRFDHSAVWTGADMIIWGGSDMFSTTDTCWWGYTSGSRFSPVTDSYTAIANAPLSGRAEHATVWTGSEMLVWGGWRDNCSYNYSADGARYSPTTNAWTLMSASPLTARAKTTAVWTGATMILFGGYNNSYQTGGAAYYPTTDTWQTLPTLNQPTARQYHTAVWTGDDMIVWGGMAGGTLSNGARYSPTANAWSALPATAAPSPRYRHTAVWTGTDMIVWGGLSGVRLGDGGRYDPVANQWYAIPATLPNSPTARWKHTATWTGTEMIVWGGDDNNPLLVTNTGARFDPLTLEWLPITQQAAPIARLLHSSIWTGREMIVWGGAYNSSENKTNSGAKYYPY